MSRTVLVRQVLPVTAVTLRGGSVREPDQVGSFIPGTSRMIANDRPPSREAIAWWQTSHRRPDAVG